MQKRNVSRVENKRGGQKKPPRAFNRSGIMSKTQKDSFKDTQDTPEATQGQDKQDRADHALGGQKTAQDAIREGLNLIRATLLKNGYAHDSQAVRGVDAQISKL